MVNFLMYILLEFLNLKELLKQAERLRQKEILYQLGLGQDRSQKSRTQFSHHLLLTKVHISRKLE